MNWQHLGFREVSTTRTRMACLLVKENPITVWVKLSDGNIIKRHKDKHGVTAP